MQDAEPFLSLAEIAGVFVGFGALIAVRSGGASGRLEVGYMRGIVVYGLLTIVAGLAPVALSFFDLVEHQIWALSSVLVLVGFVLMMVAMARTPEYRANIATEIEGRPRVIAMAEAALFGLYMLPMILIPVVIVLGGAPHLEAGLYFGLVALILLGAAWALLTLVFAQRQPEGE